MLVALLLVFAAQTAPSEPACRLAVLTLTPQGLAADQAHLGPLLTDALAAEISTTTTCAVVTERDMKDMLDVEAMKQQCGVDSDSCMAEIGGALGVDRVVAGSIGKIGASYVVAARVMNLKKGIVEARTDEVVGGSAEELRAGARAVGRRLFDPTAPAAVSPAAKASSPIASPWLWVGGGAVALGTAAAAGAGAFAFLQESALGDATQTTTQKDDALFLGRVLLGGAAVGAVVAVLGVGIAALAFLPGEESP